jgi:hypothetical protein
MTTNRTTTTTRPRRARLLIGVAIPAAMALLVAGAHHATTQLRSGDLPITTPAGAAGGPQTPVEQAPGATPGNQTTAAGDRSDPDAQPPPGGGEPEQATVTVGPVVADEQYRFVAPPDQVTVVPGRDAAIRALSQAAAGPAPTSGGSGSGTGPGPLERPDHGPDQVYDERYLPGFGIHAETTGHFATIHAGTGTGWDGGLAALRFDFGDGRSRQLTAGELGLLQPAGSVSVRHAYEPTLTSQPQRVTAVATDGAGQTHERTVEFETRAAYRLTYSPLAVTSLSDCDLIGKGDFTMKWRLDSRPARTSSFKLGKGQTYREDRFRVGINPVYYQERLEFFHVLIGENDPLNGGLSTFAVWNWPESFNPPDDTGDDEPFFTRGPVAQFGDHHYQVTLGRHNVQTGNWAGCDVRMTFAAYLQMIDEPGR